jgi:hypothetical protein
MSNRKLAIASAVISARLRDVAALLTLTRSLARVGFVTRDGLASSQSQRPDPILKETLEWVLARPIRGPRRLDGETATQGAGYYFRERESAHWSWLGSTKADAMARVCEMARERSRRCAGRGRP